MIDNRNGMNKQYYTMVVANDKNAEIKEIVVKEEKLRVEIEVDL